jgi:hypothetical protein
LSDLRFIVIIPSNPSASSSLYPSAFVGCWWDLRRNSSFYYLHIILVLGVFQGLCGVWIITAVRYVLMQVRDDKCQYQSRFGSISWTEHESQYSQAKLELYGLFCALCAYHIYIIRAKNLVVEVDTKYLKGMLNNPDIQPNTTIN